MPNYRLLTAQEAFNRAIQQYPMLYAAASLHQARCKVFDQIFNVIGNGYRNQKEFDIGFRVPPAVRAQYQTAPAKYIDGEPLYIGYTKASPLFSDDIAARMPGTENPLRGDVNSMLEGAYTEEEKHFFPEVQLWRPLRVVSDWVPYPNFKTEYSLLYKIDLSKLDASWLDEGIEFYRNAQAFFVGPNSHLYHGAWPENDRQQERLVADFKTAFSKYVEKSSDPQEQNRLISEAYEFPYTGDVTMFIQGRWAKEKARILNFIADTIEHLEVELSTRQQPKNAPTP